jgi:hypothetical protein
VSERPASATRPSGFLDVVQRERVEQEIAEDDRFEARLFYRGIVIALIVAALVVARVLFG